MDNNNEDQDKYTPEEIKEQVYAYIAIILNFSNGLSLATGSGSVPSSIKNNPKVLQNIRNGWRRFLTGTNTIKFSTSLNTLSSTSLNLKQFAPLMQELDTCLGIDDFSNFSSSYLSSMKKISKDTVRDIDQKIEKFIRNKTNVTGIDVLNFIDESLDPEIQKEILSRITKNLHLHWYIDELVADRMSP